MADQGAGPSTAPPPEVVAQRLKEAEELYERGIQCIRANELESAAEALYKVCAIRNEHYGVLALECASAHHMYGAALLYKAQDSSDVLGGQRLGTDDEGDEEAGGKENEVADDAKGKRPAEENQGGSEGGEGEGEGGAPEGHLADDLQVAWENLEIAKVIWSKHGHKFAQQLGEVHALLADISMENDGFEAAQADLETSAVLLAKDALEGDRRMAEVLFKQSMCLQFLGRPEDALAAAIGAQKFLVDRMASIQARAAAAEQAPGEAAQGAGEAGVDAAAPPPVPVPSTVALRAEAEELRGMVGDLEARVEELREVVAESEATRNMLQSAFAAMSGAAGQSAAGSKEDVAGQDRPAGAGVVGGVQQPGAPVQDLGVVGRGTKRINLAPVHVDAASGGAAAAAQAGSTQPAKKKRSMEDLVGAGGPAAETIVGFGSEQGPEPASEVPAFLKAGNVAAIYTTPGDS